MERISYSQNLEDVILWRTLGHVGPGFYIDVGAAWPDHDSVTKLFYDAGWRGINVEPNPHLHQMLEQQRHRDVNLRMALGTHSGSVLMDIVADTGLSTADDAIGEALRSAGHAIDQIRTPIDTLANIWREHVPPGTDVQFLKIDVEGFEEAVLRGWDGTAHRPWVIVVEATRPGTQDEVHDAWEPILIDARYSFAYADGVNRFYLAEEQQGLRHAFRYPPNVFDGFRTATEVASEQRAALHDVERLKAEHRVAVVEHQLRVADERANWLAGCLGDATAQADLIRVDLDVLHQENHSLRFDLEWAIGQATAAHAEAARINAHVERMQRSASWRVTAPLRLTKRTVRKLLVRAVRPAVVAAVRIAAPRPALRSVAVRVLAPWPALRARLRVYDPSTFPAVSRDVLPPAEPGAQDAQTSRPGSVDSAATLDVLAQLERRLMVSDDRRRRS